MIRANAHRFGAIRTLVSVGLLAIGVVASTAVPAIAAASGFWTTTSSMTTPRSGPRVRRCSKTAKCWSRRGIKNFDGMTRYRPVTLASAELYDPSKSTWSATGSMNVARAGVQATLLENGQVLMAQGTAEPYDPSKGRWTLTAPVPWPGPGGSAALLTNGDVLSYGTISRVMPASSTTHSPTPGL